MLLFHMGALRFGLSTVKLCQDFPLVTSVSRIFFLEDLLVEQMRAEKRSISEYCPKSLCGNGLHMEYLQELINKVTSKSVCASDMVWEVRCQLP